MSQSNQNPPSIRYELGEPVISINSPFCANAKYALALTKKSIYKQESSTSQFVKILHANPAPGNMKELYSFAATTGSDGSLYGIVSLINKTTNTIDEVILFKDDKFIPVQSSSLLSLPKKEHNVCIDEDLNCYVINSSIVNGKEAGVMSTAFKDAKLTFNDAINKAVASATSSSNMNGYHIQSIQVTQKGQYPGGPMFFFIGTDKCIVLGTPVYPMAWSSVYFTVNDTVNTTYDYDKDRIVALVNQNSQTTPIAFIFSRLRGNSAGAEETIPEKINGYPPPYPITSALSVSHISKLCVYTVWKNTNNKLQIMTVHSPDGNPPSKIPPQDVINCLYQFKEILYVGDNTGISAYKENDILIESAPAKA